MSVMRRAKDHDSEIQPTWWDVNLTPRKQIMKKEKLTHNCDFFVTKIISTLFSPSAQNYEDNQFFLFFSSSFFKQR